MAVTPQVWQYRIIVHHVPVYRKAISGLLIDRTRIIGQQRRQTTTPESVIQSRSWELLETGIALTTGHNSKTQAKQLPKASAEPLRIPNWAPFRLCPPPPLFRTG